MKRYFKIVATLTAMAGVFFLLRLYIFVGDRVPVIVATAEPGRVEEAVTNTRGGTLEVRRRAKLSPEVGGVVIALPFREGQRVAKGDVVLELDDQLQRAQLDLALCQNSAPLKWGLQRLLDKRLWIRYIGAMTYRAPGRADREGITVIELMDMFPTEEAATQWFEAVVWNGERCCGKCGSLRTSEVPNGKPMPYWCSDCRGYFSVRTGTPIARSNVPLRKWAIAVYLCLTSLKSVSSMKLHRDIGVSQPTAWFMLHRIREAWSGPNRRAFGGPVEIDETFVGGKSRNMHAHKREQVIKGRGSIGKTAVVGAKDRRTNRVSAAVIDNVDQPTLQGFVASTVEPGAKVYTDDHGGYVGLPNHETVRHSVKEYVDGMVHTNGIESFWSMLKRAHKGTFHKLSPKHLQRYVDEFAGKHNMRDSGTLAQMRDTVASMVGRNLLYRNLIADNGLSSMRSS